MKMKTMEKKPQNPFLLTGYISPEYFCDREKESAKLLSALRNGRNITLISPRRMGKTGLINHVFFQMMESSSDTACYYVDLYQTDSLQSLVKKFANAVLGTLDTREQRIVKNVIAFFKSLRPTINIDPISGEPTFSVDVQPEMAEHSLVEIFSYMEQSGKECFVAFDEFQTISSYADKNIEALLRSYIQRLTSVHFIFSGSQRHLLESMFASAARPFYQSTQTMPLYEIAPDAYYNFARKKYEAHNQHMPREVFQHLYDTLFGHTWYVQTLLNRLYEIGDKEITSEQVDSTLMEITEENEATYHTFLRLVAPGQGKLLKAIAAEGSVSELLNQSFISRHQLGATSSVKSAAKVLVEKELLLDEDDKYQIYDRFFGLWLKWKFGGKDALK